MNLKLNEEGDRVFAVIQQQKSEIERMKVDYSEEHKIHHVKIQSLKAILKNVCEHLEYLCIALAEQTTGNSDKLAMWNSASTMNVLKNAQALVNVTNPTHDPLKIVAEIEKRGSGRVLLTNKPKGAK